MNVQNIRNEYNMIPLLVHHENLQILWLSGEGAPRHPHFCRSRFLFTVSLSPSFSTRLAPLFVFQVIYTYIYIFWFVFLNLTYILLCFITFVWNVLFISLTAFGLALIMKLFFSDSAIYINYVGIDNNK